MPTSLLAVTLNVVINESKLLDIKKLIINKEPKSVEKALTFSLVCLIDLFNCCGTSLC